MSSLKEYIQHLLYFIRGFEYYVFFLFSLAVIIGLIDAFSISLLYPMLSVGFKIQTDNIPLYGLIEQISSLIPMGSPFVHLGLLFIILTGTSLLLQLVYWKVAFIFQRKIIIRTKKSIFSKIDSHDYKFFVETKQGDLINLFNQSPFYVQQTYDKLICLCADLLSSLIVVGMLFFISPGGLILVIFGGGIFYIVINSISKNFSEKLGQLQIASGQSENKVINEYINGIKTITALHVSAHWEKLYNNALKIYWDRFAEFMFIQRIPIIAINSLFYITIGVIVLILYIYYADNFQVVIPLLGTFAAGMMKILPKIMNMGNYKLELKSYLPHINTVYSSLNERKYLTVINGDVNCQEIISDITFQNVSFSYGHYQVLDKISINIKKGAMTALVGPSGSGKSTIASLLLRLYDPQSGSIQINGRNMKEYDIGSFRDIIGYVSQESFIFNGTIRENIIFGGEFSDIEMIEVSKLAHAHEFITELPDGYDTLVGDQGVTLSGGERQRIAIARAMIRHPELLILDEATSALDNISEAAVQVAIDEVTKECTTLVIAHRLTTIKNALKIFVIEKGKILEEGTHSELITKKGVYENMYNSVNNNSP